MAETSDKGIWLSYENIESGLQQVGSFITSLLKPLFSPITRIMGEGSTGFFVIAALFFLIWLIQKGASTRAPEVYGSSMQRLGSLGLALCVVYITVMGLERLMLPILTTLLFLAVAEGVGSSPNLSDLILVINSSEGRKSLAEVVAKGIGTSGTVLPLSLRSVALLAGAFACMYVVGVLFQLHGRKPNN
jgi:type IV secretory pathway VirB3-like protein